MTHRSYRVYRPTQVIRYDNRIEIINAGYSLKPEDELGQPGSIVRNQIISTVFHETNLAENKGSGISVMQKLMKESNLAPPTFESNHHGNTFTIRLLLHHFLGQDDLKWLDRFSRFSLNDSQKTALIFTRKTGAVDNSAYRQMSGCDTLKASSDLRAMKDMGILCSKGKGRSTYYVPASSELTQQPQDLMPQPQDLITQPQGLMTQPRDLTQQPFPPELMKRIAQLKSRERNPDIIRELIVDLCRIRPMTPSEIASLLKRSEEHIRKRFLPFMISEGEIQYLYPEMINHPYQAYTAAKKN